MLGYAQCYGVAHLVLLYPHATEGLPGLQRRFHIRDPLPRATGQIIHFATVDLRDLGSVPDQLRRLIGATEAPQTLAAALAGPV
jgi:hypothetical protein